MTMKKRDWPIHANIHIWPVVIGKIGRAVTTDARSLHSNQQFLLNIFSLLTVRRKEEKEAGNGPFLST